ncbi:MAG: hypothetical protein H0X69_13225 [Gemmatimonadales bacterium]|nr:hypothetical protein [Gemmatimonadales bacterium]
MEHDLGVGNGVAVLVRDDDVQLDDVTDRQPFTTAGSADSNVTVSPSIARPSASTTVVVSGRVPPRGIRGMFGATTMPAGVRGP